MSDFSSCLDSRYLMLFHRSVDSLSWSLTHSLWLAILPLKRFFRSNSMKTLNLRKLKEFPVFFPWFNQDFEGLEVIWGDFSHFSKIEYAHRHHLLNGFWWSLTFSVNLKNTNPMTPDVKKLFELSYSW